MFGPFSRSSSVTTNCIKYITEYIKIALSELRSVLQCLYHAALQVWLYSTVVKVVNCGIADGRVGDSVRYFLVVWDLKEVVPVEGDVSILKLRSAVRLWPEHLLASRTNKIHMRSVVLTLNA